TPTSSLSPYTTLFRSEVRFRAVVPQLLHERPVLDEAGLTGHGEPGARIGDGEVHLRSAAQRLGLTAVQAHEEPHVRILADALDRHRVREQLPVRERRGEHDEVRVAELLHHVLLAERVVRRHGVLPGVLVRRLMPWPGRYA